MSSTGAVGSETTYRGVKWRQDSQGGISFFDADGERWVRWAAGVDAPPRPPGWAGTRVARPRFLSSWRLIPLVLVVAAVVVAIVQATQPSSSNTAKEAAAAQAMLGRCLAQHGTAEGHPKYSSATVSCTSTDAAVKVVEVLPTTPGSPACPAGATGFELPYAGVKYPHVECVHPLSRGG